LRAGHDGSGLYVSATDFDVTSHDWQLTGWDADGYVRIGPVGEGVGRADGIASTEVGYLAETPGADHRRDTADYKGGTTSTFGAPNVWDGDAQDLDAMRGLVSGVVEVRDTGEPEDTDLPADTDLPDTDAPTAAPDDDSEAPACGCATRGPAALLPALGALALRSLRRRRV
jgi:hypothetical protein